MSAQEVDERLVTHRDQDRGGAQVRMGDELFPGVPALRAGGIGPTLICRFRLLLGYVWRVLPGLILFGRAEHFKLVHVTPPKILYTAVRRTRYRREKHTVGAGSHLAVITNIVR